MTDRPTPNKQRSRVAKTQAIGKISQLEDPEFRALLTKLGINGHGLRSPDRLERARLLVELAEKQNKIELLRKKLIDVRPDLASNTPMWKSDASATYIKGPDGKFRGSVPRPLKPADDVGKDPGELIATNVIGRETELEVGDQIIRRCKECGQAFSMSYDVQRYFVSHGLTLPMRCPTCRAQHRNRLRPLTEDRPSDEEPVLPHEQRPLKHPIAVADKPIPQCRLRVFLCHSSNDKPRVRDLYKRLIVEGLDPWLDEEKLLPGQKWGLEIPRAVRNSDVVIICLSHTSINKAGYVQKEIRLALDAADERPEGTIFIIPLRLEDCQVPERLCAWHWVDFFVEQGYERLMRALRECAKDHGSTTWH